MIGKLYELQGRGEQVEVWRAELVGGKLHIQSDSPTRTSLVLGPRPFKRERIAEALEELPNKYHGAYLRGVFEPDEAEPVAEGGRGSGNFAPYHQGIIGTQGGSQQYVSQGHTPVGNRQSAGPGQFALGMNFKQAARVASAITKLHNTDTAFGNGSTYNFTRGNLSGEPEFVASLFPELTDSVYDKNITTQDILGFMRQHAGLLKDDRYSIGTWYNDEEEHTYIDIVVTVPDRALAMILGLRYNQISIWDLKEGDEINTGGDGKAIKNLPPVAKRLDFLKDRSEKQ